MSHISIEELAESQKRTEKAFQNFANGQLRLLDAELERSYRDKSYAYLGTVMRRVRAVSWPEIEETLEAHLSDAETSELSLLDVLVRGRLKGQPDTPDVWLAMEVSFVVDRKDVERAQRRAALLRKVGYLVVPAVGGEEVTLGGEDAAREGNVFLLQNGRKQFWEEALTEALAD